MDYSTDDRIAYGHEVTPIESYPELPDVSNGELTQAAYDESNVYPSRADFDYGPAAAYDGSEETLSVATNTRTEPSPTEFASYLAVASR